MYKGNSKRYSIESVIIAALGAGIATSFAFSQGQSPFLALGITIFAAIAALLIDRFLLP